MLFFAVTWEALRAVVLELSKLPQPQILHFFTPGDCLGRGTSQMADIPKQAITAKNKSHHFTELLSALTLGHGANNLATLVG